MRNSLESKSEALSTLQLHHWTHSSVAAAVLLSRRQGMDICRERYTEVLGISFRIARLY